MKTPPGTIVWRDLTVPNAEDVRDFYKAVVGWDHEDVDMGSYADYNMLPSGGEEPAAGICHSRGRNSALPQQWILYVQVENIDQSVDACEERGGSVIDGPRDMGQNRFCLIQDPAGAFMGLVE